MPILSGSRTIMFDPYRIPIYQSMISHPTVPKLLKVASWPRIARSAREDSPLSTWWAEIGSLDRMREMGDLQFEVWKHSNWKTHPPTINGGVLIGKDIYKWRTFRCHCWVPKGMFMIVGRGTYPSPDVSSWRMKIPWCLWHSAILVVMSCYVIS